MLDLNSMLFENMALHDAKIGTASSTALVGGYVDTTKTGHRFSLVVMLSDMASETIDIGIFEASDSSGTGEAALKTATQLAASATANDDKEVIVEIGLEEVDPAKPFIAGRVLTGGATGGTVAILMLQGGAHHGPQSDHNVSTVLEVKR